VITSRESLARAKTFVESGCRNGTLRVTPAAGDSQLRRLPVKSCVQSARLVVIRDAPSELTKVRQGRVSSRSEAMGLKASAASA
jgi:hypothetical protein